MEWNLIKVQLKLSEALPLPALRNWQVKGPEPWWVHCSSRDIPEPWGLDASAQRWRVDNSLMLEKLLRLFLILRHPSIPHRAGGMGTSPLHEMTKPGAGGGELGRSSCTPGLEQMVHEKPGEACRSQDSAAPPPPLATSSSSLRSVPLVGGQFGGLAGPQHHLRNTSGSFSRALGGPGSSLSSDLSRPVWKETSRHLRRESWLLEKHRRLGSTESKLTHELGDLGPGQPHTHTTYIHTTQQNTQDTQTHTHIDINTQAQIPTYNHTPHR